MDIVLGVDEGQIAVIIKHLGHSQLSVSDAAAKALITIFETSPLTAAQSFFLQVGVQFAFR